MSKLKVCLIRIKSLLQVEETSYIDYVQKYATNQAADDAGGSEGEESDEEMSDIGEFSDEEDEVRCPPHENYMNLD